jgi:sulfite reductase (NADPH) hemoprotein beta-component
MSENTDLQFPCTERPEDPSRRSLLGIYGQRQEGVHMQRIKIHRGQLAPDQLAALADLAREYTPDYPLHVTTRQDIQLHGVRPEDLPAVQRAIDEAGLTTLGACGDSLRNVTTCPENGLREGTPEVSRVADAIREAGESLPFIRNMPRKFKMSLSCCRDLCARPWINDLGLVARPDGTFRVIGAGSLGRRPATGIELYESVELDEVVPLVVAALRFFNAEGNRQKRYSARWRHVRERMGDDAFKARLDQEFHEERQNGDWPVPQMPVVSDGIEERAHLRLPLGDLSVELAKDLAERAGEAGGTIRLGFEHDLFVFAPQPVDLSAELEELTDGPVVVACPGTTWCARGLSNSRQIETEVRKHWPEGLKLALGFSGCPNNCAHAAVADIGLTGRVKTIDGQRTHCFRLFAGGDRGFSPRMATELHRAVPQEQAPSIIKWLAEGYARSEHEAFADFIAAEGQRISRDIEDRLGISAERQ